MCHQFLREFNNSLDRADNQSRLVLHDPMIAFLCCQMLAKRCAPSHRRVFFTPVLWGGTRG